MTSQDMSTPEATMPDESTTGLMNGSTSVETSARARPRKLKNGKESVSGRGRDAAEPRSKEQSVATRSLSVVLRALGRHQARSIMLEHLARVALEDFRGCEATPPKKLLRLPNGIRYAVEPDDAEELYIELVRLAGDERIQMQAI